MEPYLFPLMLALNILWKNVLEDMEHDGGEKKEEKEKQTCSILSLFLDGGVR